MSKPKHPRGPVFCIGSRVGIDFGPFQHEPSELDKEWLGTITDLYSQNGYVTAVIRWDDDSIPGPKVTVVPTEFLV